MKTLEEFRAETQTETIQQEFALAEETFKIQPSMAKYDKAFMISKHSYIWYEDPETNEKIAIRMSNKNVEKYILGKGTYGTAKYGIDKKGNLYAIKIQHNYATSYYIQNANGLPVETQIQILNGVYVPLIPPQTIILIDNILYFQAKLGEPPKALQLNIAAQNYERDSYDVLVSEISTRRSTIVTPVQPNSGLTDSIIYTLIASNIKLEYNSMNQSMSPVDEAEITQDVRVALGHKTRQATSAFIVQFLEPNDAYMQYGIIYANRDPTDGSLRYKILDTNHNVIYRKTDIPYPHHIPCKPHEITRIITFARQCRDIPEKNPLNPLPRTGEKQYQVIKLGESTLYNALAQHITLHEKISITRRVLWESYKLHTGKLSRSHRQYIHCDLKPENILLNKSQNNVLLIDYGLSVSTDTTDRLIGTDWYSPVIGGMNPCDPQAPNFDRHHANRVAYLQTGFDVFSLKRTIYMPDHQENPQRCIFNRDEWHILPPQLTQNIAIHNDEHSIDMAIGTIRAHNETALTLAMRFIAMEAVDLSQTRDQQETAYNANLQHLTRMTPEHQEMACECAEILDYIQAHDPTHTQHTVQTIIDAVANKSLPKFTILLLRQACLLLINKIDQTTSTQWSKQIAHIITSSNKPTIQTAHLYELFQQLREINQSAINKEAALQSLLEKESTPISTNTGLKQRLADIKGNDEDNSVHQTTRPGTT